MRAALRTLDASYRAHAVPAGSARYFSWLFAAAEARAPLLGIYALLSEWNALMDPATGRDVARIKLAWWGEEMRRLVAAAPVHPISIYLHSLPRASQVDFSPLILTVDAAAAQAAGAAPERAADLAAQAQALRANPLAVASRLAAADLDEAALRRCTGALAVAEHVSRSLRGYRREARFGRVSFAVDELLAQGVENADLTAEHAPARLAGYLDQLRTRAIGQYEIAAAALPGRQRAAQRHLLVLAALGSRQLQSSPAAGRLRPLRDMLLAWTTARRAQRNSRSP